MNEYIILADGTVIENSYVIKLSETDIAVFIKTIENYNDIVNLFTDAEKTREIHSDQYGDKNDWNGYTENTSITNDEYSVTVCLAKGAE